MSFSGDSQGFMNYIFDRYKTLHIKDIAVMYEGQVTHQVMKALTRLVEEQMDETDDDMVMRRVYHVMVESLQNINRHAEAFEMHGHPYPGMGLILVSRDDERYQVTTCNIIENSHVDEISGFLDRLNNMSSGELDDLYKEQMRDGIMSPKGGAGLGFIDVRRKTRNTMDYSFEKMDDQTSLFIFTSTITR